MARPELVELLAHLDFLVEGPKLWSLQDSDTEEHIHRVLTHLTDKLGYQYTVDQIRERLWQEFRHSYDYPEYNFPQLFLHGSSSIQTLNPQTEQLLKDRLAALHLEAVHTPRSQRSRSVLPAPRTTPNRNRNNPSTLAPPSARAKAGNRRTRSDATHASKKKKKSLKARIRVKSQSRSQTAQSATVVPSVEIDEAPFHSPSISSSAKEHGHPSPLTSIKPIRWPTPVSHKSGKQDDNPIAQRSCETTNSSCLAAISAEAYGDIISELAHYKQRCEKAEQECTNLKMETRQIKSFYDQTKGVPEEMLKELNFRMQQITVLKKRQFGQRDLEPYLSIGRVHGDVPTTQQLLLNFKDMKDELAAIVVLNGTCKPSFDSLYGQCADLDALLRTVFDLGIRSNAEKIWNASPEITLQELIQALTGASIHCWVFESRYRPIAMTSTPLLQKYRDQIAILCGHEGLCNLDNAAHQSMIDEKDFKDVTIPRMASRHTTRLLNALQPLFDKRYQHKTTRKLTVQLDCIFRLAIKIRSLSLIGTKDYESIWPSSGSPFDNNEMETECLAKATTASLVKLPLSPGLRSFAKDKDMVGYDGFGNGDVRSRTAKDIVKAIVLI